jgi:hypothetical protein
MGASIEQPDEVSQKSPEFLQATFKRRALRRVNL